MKLYGTLTSPYVRKVRVVLAEKKLECALVIEPPSTPESVIPRINPLGQIPVLMVDENTPVFDSRVIVEYLDNLTPNNKLFPQPNRERTVVKRWEAVADGILDAAVLARKEQMQPEAQKSDEFIANLLARISRSLDFLEKELGEQAYCMGTHFSHADIAVGCALGYLQFRFPQINWPETHAALTRLYEKLLQRPSFSETVHQE